MKKVIVLLILLAGAVWVGLSLQHEQDIMFIVAGKSIQMKLWVAIFAVVIILALVYFVLRFVSSILNIPGWVSSLRQKRRHKYSQTKTNLGLLALAEGNWKNAERNLIQGAKAADVPLVNYLAAAKAASEQGLEEKRDEYLSLAHDATRGTDMAVGLTQAQLQFNHGQLEQSLATLKQLRSSAPRHPYVIKLLKAVYIELKDWQNLLELLPMLSRQHVSSSQEVQSLEKLAHFELLKAIPIEQTQQIKDQWDNMPKHLHHEPDIVAVYAKNLINAGQKDDAEYAMRACLKKNWDEQLVMLLGNFKSNNPTKTLSVAEGWLKSHPESSGLLLTCGKLAAQNELWGKAQRYLEACLSFDRKLEAYAVLGLIYEKMDKPALSAECFRKGMLSNQEHVLSENLIEHQPVNNQNVDME